MRRASGFHPDQAAHHLLPPVQDEGDGHLTARGEKPGAHPEKTVCTLTECGEAVLREMLAGLARFEYRPTFPADGAFVISDRVDPAMLREGLKRHAATTHGAIRGIKAHWSESLSKIPPE